MRASVSNDICAPKLMNMRRGRALHMPIFLRHLFPANIKITPIWAPWLLLVRRHRLLGLVFTISSDGVK